MMFDDMGISLRIAREEDAVEIADLVNRAYRPLPQQAGWTHEADLIDGKRTSAAKVLSLFRDGSVILLLTHDDRIVSCVHVQRADSSAYIGMLATAPAMQGRDLGKRMLLHAEQYATECFGASVIRMSVLSTRPELLAFYERRGYTLTDEIGEYPLSLGVGRPKVDGIHVLSLIKFPATSS
ncbi:GNAT family N-acetyltransferase [Azospirillum canadense]|uniref:GNAT family N-acetyltransferase n=1 Tax=Azospirillum canadense TaxID=403962 RepID=UPI0022278B52|nr:GNAT family N-acetyltransferase [Azospirillum canadense]MCW2240542.1 ribosomal protein S18 acetylase RimI-like enzyme [Azospirillum canadense]